MEPTSYAAAGAPQAGGYALHAFNLPAAYARQQMMKHSFDGRAASVRPAAARWRSTTLRYNLPVRL